MRRFNSPAHEQIHSARPRRKAFFQSPLHRQSLTLTSGLEQIEDSPSGRQLVVRTSCHILSLACAVVVRGQQVNGFIER